MWDEREAPCAACGVVGGGGAAPPVPSSKVPHTLVDSDIRASIPQSAYCLYPSIGVDCENDMGNPITLIHRIDSSLGGQLRAVKR